MSKYYLLIIEGEVVRAGKSKLVEESETNVICKITTLGETGWKEEPIKFCKESGKEIGMWSGKHTKEMIKYREVKFERIREELNLVRSFLHKELEQKIYVEAGNDEKI